MESVVIARFFMVLVLWGTYVRRLGRGAGSVDVRFGEAGDVKVSGSELWWKVTAMESHGDFLLHPLRLLLPQCSGKTRTREMITVMVCESMGWREEGKGSIELI